MRRHRRHAHDAGLRAGRAEGLERGRAEGLEQSLGEGIARERAVLVRLAARKFDAPTAERVAAFLATLEDPDRLAEACDLIIECDDADDLLSRLGDAEADTLGPARS